MEAFCFAGNGGGKTGLAVGLNANILRLKMPKDQSNE